MRAARSYGINPTKQQRRPERAVLAISFSAVGPFARFLGVAAARVPVILVLLGVDPHARLDLLGTLRVSTEEPVDRTRASGRGGPKISQETHRQPPMRRLGGPTRVKHAGLPSIAVAAKAPSVLSGP